MTPWMTPLSAARARADHLQLREHLNEGAIYLVDPTAPSTELADRAMAVLDEELGPDPRTAHMRLDDEALFYAIGRVRKAIYLSREFEEMTRRVIASLGYDLGAVAFDPPRIRAVIHDGHLNPRAAAVYGGHRDTWYGHPSNLVTWWVPLHDLADDETFVFYPECFDRSVPNDSHVFDYDAWTARGWNLKIGWQDRDAGLRATYPRLLDEPRPELGPRVGFSCQKGHNLLFCGAHLHQTLPQSLGTIRYSLDFRLVHLPDFEQGRGAPNPDDHSRGLAIADYVQPRSATP